MQLEERRKSLSIVANLRYIIAEKAYPVSTWGLEIRLWTLSFYRHPSPKPPTNDFPPFPAFSLPSHTESFHIAIPDRGGYFRICLNQILPWKKIRITMCLCSRIGARRNRRLSPAACPSFRGRMRRGTRVRPKQPAGKRDVQTPRRC